MTTDDGVVKLWRVGLLSALGLTLLVRSFSYEDWALLGHEVRGSFDLRLRAAGETAPPAAVRSTPQVDLSDIVRASPQPIWDPRVRWSVPYPLPNGTRLDRTVAGPNGTVVVFYGEPIPAPPEPPFVLCATGYVGPPTHRWMVGTFDASRRQVSAVALERVGSVDAAFVQPDGGIVVWGRLDQRGDGSADTVLFRIGLDGIDPTFQDLRRSQLAWQDASLWRTPEITSVRMADDGTFDLSGYFTSVRGVPRRHNACLRADGSLAD